MLNARRVVWIASLAVLVGAFGSPRPAEAQVDLEGATRLAFTGSLTSLAGDAVGLVNAGLSRVLDGGTEFGGDMFLVVSGGGADGFLFFRGTHNFVRESLTVPFVTAGVGIPLGGFGGAYPFQGGGGIKRFLNEDASLDVMAAYQAILNSFGGSSSVSVQFGLSFYFGN